MKVLKPNTLPIPSTGQFIRNSTATYIDDNGVLQTAGVNEPRWQNGELLLEEQRTNLFTYSNDAQTAWSTKSRITVTSDSIVAPDGTLSADTLVEDTTNGGHYVERGVTQAANTPITFSVFIKKNNRADVWLNVYANGYADNIRGAFNLDTGVTSVAYGGTATGASATMQNIGNGWFRLVLSGTPSTAAVTDCKPRISIINQSTVYTGDGVSGAYFWGAQLEAGAFATSYIPTTTTAVTRQADVCVGNFSRTSTATYVDSSGVIQTAAINEPRIQNGKLLLEGEGTNYCLRSEQFDNSFWIKTAGSVAANTTLAPDGNVTADTFTISTLSVVQGLSVQLATDGLSAETFSFFIMKQSDTPFSAYFRSTIGSGSMYSILNGNLSTGFISLIQGSASFSNYTWEDFGNFYRISITAKGLPAGTIQAHIRLNNMAVGSTVVVWGAQIEKELLPTSYIPTVDSSVTRAADIHTAGLVYTNAVETTLPWESSGTYDTLGEIVVYNNILYENIQAHTVVHQPDISPTYWLALGADNISAAFDGKVGSKTTATDKLRMIIYPGTTIDAVGYLETNAVVVNTSAVDAQRNIAYSNSTGISESTIENWYDYFFVSPLADPATQVVHQGIPALDPGLFIGIELINPGTVEVGSVLTGYSTTLGKTQYGLKAGIVDYSKKEADEFGNITIVERPFSKRMSADVYVPNYDLNKVQRFLYNIRATPVLWMASDDPNLAEVSYVYGFYKDFSTTISYPDVSMCNLEIEGLI